jgi:hypothetical protein
MRGSWWDCVTPLLRILAGIATSGDSNDTPQPTQDGEAVDR